MNRRNLSLQSTEEVCLPISEVGPAIGFSTRTAYNRIQELGWRKEEDRQKRVWVWVPKEYIVNPKFLGEEAANGRSSAEPAAAVSPASFMDSTLQKMEEVKQQYEARLADKDKLVAALEKQLEDKAEQLSALNNELSNHKFQIQRYKAQEELLQDLQGKLNQLLEKEARPWWRFWG